MEERPCGFFGVESFGNGNPLAPSCGSMENVRSPLTIRLPDSLLMIVQLISGLREEHPLVSDH
jgi:hypothetical protein